MRLEEMQNARIIELETELLTVRAENEALRKRFQRARGLPAEELVARLTGGKRSVGYKDSHDVTTPKGNRIEVKLSKVHFQKNTKCPRWTWNRVLGTKIYDFLVLAGDKENALYDGYPADFEYVLFLIPRHEVDMVKDKGNGQSVALNVNFATIRSLNGKLLRDRFLVRSPEQFEGL